MARQSGVPEEPLRRYAAERAEQGGSSPGLRARSSPPGISWTASLVVTDLGEWVAYETPGHAPSHVCLFQPERRLLISGDHLLGRISLASSSATRRTRSVSSCARWTSSSGSARAYAWRATDGRSPMSTPTSRQPARSSRSSSGTVLGAVGEAEPTAFDVVTRSLYGDALSQQNGHWLLSQTLGYLTHLESVGEVTRVPGEPDRWTA